MGLRNLFSSCAVYVVSVLVLAGNRFWLYILLCTWSTIQLWCCVGFFGSGGKQFLVLRTYLVHNTVVRLCHFFCCGGKINFSSCLSGGLSVFGSADYDRKKKSFSRLSGGLVLAITTGKKKVPVVCLAGCAVVVLAITTGKKKVPVICLAKKKRYSRLSVGCAVLVITTGKKRYSHLFNLY